MSFNARFSSLSHFVVCALFVVAGAAQAQDADYVRDDLHAKLRRAMERGGKVTVTGVPLGAKGLKTIEIEPMKVWADDARVFVHTDEGMKVQKPMPASYFKGHVVGEDESTVFLRMNERRQISGIVTMGDRQLHIGSGILRRNGRLLDRGNAEDRAPVLVSEVDPLAEQIAGGEPWTCDLDKMKMTRDFTPKSAAAKTGDAKADAGNLSGVSYTLRIAIETDYELFQGFGSQAAVESYLATLVGATSIFYERDMATTLVLGDIHVWTTAADPWTVTTASPNTTLTALAEFGTYWHNNYSSIPRSTAVMVSGKHFYGGIAWGGNQMCSNDFYCGDTGSNCGDSSLAGKYGGGYAYVGSIGVVTTSVPDPTATVNGVQYALPNNNNHWMLLGFAHELGHNINGPHTHCVALSETDKATYGVTRNYVDECYSGECYSGTVSAPAELGTVMSYCHNVTSGSFRQSRYVMTKAGETSEKMKAYFTTALEAGSPNPDITYTDAAPIPCSTGRTASVAACTDCSYAWQIAGGTITSSTTANTVTFTPSEENVTLTVTVTNAKGCGITYSLTRTAACGAVSAPTNVTATANGTAVNVSWNASAGATGYRVLRSTDGTNYTQVGADLGAVTSYNDTSASSGTAYLYIVRALNGGTVSGDSNRDMAVPMSYTDATLTAGSTIMRAAHMAELRNAVNALRVLAGLPLDSFTDATLDSSVPVKALHVTELQVRLNSARTALGFDSATFSSVSSGNTCQAAHIVEVREGLR